MSKIIVPIKVEFNLVVGVDVNEIETVDVQVGEVVKSSEADELGEPINPPI